MIYRLLTINLNALAHNIEVVRGQINGARIMAMVKASSYGNGDFEIANFLATQGIDYLAVAFAEEGVALRKAGIRMPIVVLNDESYGLMIDNRLEPEIYNFRGLRGFIRAAEISGERRYPIHIKVDSGMHRWGFGEDDVEQLISLLQAAGDAVEVRSVFSHLAVADDPAEDTFTRHQLADFQRLADKISALLPYRPLRHIANSAAIRRFPEAQLDMCRLGIALYGLGSEELQPVSRLTTRIMQLRTVEGGETVGYGREGAIASRRRLATLPIGYADGLDRRLGNGRWSMLVRGNGCPTVGRISMDSCIIDVTDIQAVEGDEVVVFSSAAGNGIEDMARILDTIPYEVMTSISDRVKRLYVKE